MATPRVGAQLYTLREFHKTADGFAASMKKVADMGYKHVQVSGIGPIDPKDVARICQDNALEISCTHMGWPRFLNELDAVIEEHTLWNCKHPAIGGLPKEYFQAGADGVRKFIDELGPVAEKLSAAGMDFSYHNHNHELMKVNGRTWLGMLYDEAPVEILKAELDVYWVTAGGGDPTQWLTKCAGRQPLMHLKDMTIAEGREQRFAPIGEGNLNWPSIFKAAEASGVEYALVEQDNCYGADPYECLAKSLNFCKELGWTA